MAKFGLKALGVILKKIVFLANQKYATKADLARYNNPSLEGTHLTFPSNTTAKVEGTHLVLTE